MRAALYNLERLSSLRVRGTADGLHCVIGVERVIPARAGNSALRVTTGPSRAGHPCVCAVEVASMPIRAAASYGI